MTRMAKAGLPTRVRNSVANNRFQDNQKHNAPSIFTAMETPFGNSIVNTIANTVSSSVSPALLMGQLVFLQNTQGCQFVTFILFLFQFASLLNI